MANYISKYTGEEIDNAVSHNEVQDGQIAKIENDIDSLNILIDENKNNINSLDSSKVNKVGDTIEGKLNINSDLSLSRSDGYPTIYFNDTSNNKINFIQLIGTNHRLVFAEKANDTDYKEYYYLPRPNDELTANKEYYILTSKTPVSIAQGGTNASTVTEAQKNLKIVDLIYPIGSTYINSTNTNPSTLFGGTWELYDKDFKYEIITSPENYITLNSTNVSAVSGGGYRDGDIIQLSLTLTTKVAITDTTLEMLTLKLSELGATAITASYYTNMTDGGQSVLNYNLTNAGVLSTRDVIVRGSSTGSLSTDYNPHLVFKIHVPWNKKIDSFCDKFYWKRTA